MYVKISFIKIEMTLNFRHSVYKRKLTFMYTTFHVICTTLAHYGSSHDH